MAKSLEESTRPGEKVSVAGEEGTITRSVAVVGGHEVTVVISDDSERAPKVGHAVHEAAWSNNVAEQEEANAKTYAETAKAHEEAAKEDEAAQKELADSAADTEKDNPSDSGDKDSAGAKTAVNSTTTGAPAKTQAASAKSTAATNEKLAADKK
jgi:hypothetical protein